MTVEVYNNSTHAIDVGNPSLLEPRKTVTCELTDTVKQYIAEGALIDVRKRDAEVEPEIDPEPDAGPTPEPKPTPAKKARANQGGD